MSQECVGHIITLFTSTKGTSTRTKQSTIKLDEGGIIGDKFHNKSISRSVLLTSLDSYTLTQSHNITMHHGALGENLLMDYNPYHLPSGAKLQVGEVILEISQYCTMCDHLAQIDEALPSLLKNDRGIFTKVLKAGEIKEGDKIILLNA